MARLNISTKELYMQEATFSSIWKFLRSSVQLGINLAKRNKTNKNVYRPEDIVVLTYIKKDGMSVSVRNGAITYRQNISPEEEKILNGKKQSALDNKDNRYFYSDDDTDFHDKECEAVKNILPEHFKASKERPIGFAPCPKCKRQMALREMCSPFVKQIPSVNRLLTKKKISDKQLWKYAFCYKLKMNYENQDELKVKGREDTWIVEGFDENKLTLWHNNYTKLSPIERIITSGYHKQDIGKMSLNLMLEYINEYTFDRHIEGEIVKNEDNPEVVQAIVDSYETLGIAQTAELVSKDDMEIIESKMVEQIKYNIGFWSRIRRATMGLIGTIF